MRWLLLGLATDASEEEGEGRDYHARVLETEGKCGLILRKEGMKEGCARCIKTVAACADE